MAIICIFCIFFTSVAYGNNTAVLFHILDHHEITATPHDHLEASQESSIQHTETKKSTDLNVNSKDQQQPVKGHTHSLGSKIEITWRFLTDIICPMFSPVSLVEFAIRNNLHSTDYVSMLYRPPRQV